MFLVVELKKKQNNKKKTKQMDPGVNSVLLMFLPSLEHSPAFTH